MTLYDVNQQGWGHPSPYRDDARFKPRYIVVHWGGGTSQIPAEGEDDRLRIWRNYHINSKGMRDIAYNYAIGDESHLCYRLRGLNYGGHTSSTNDRTPEGDSYNHASVGVVLVTGAADVDGFSQGGLERLGQLIRDLQAQFGPLVVKAHSTVKQENGSNTACPGDQVEAWIDSEGWNVPVVVETIKLEVPDPRVEPILWDLFYIRGGVRDNSKNASQNLQSVGLGDDPRKLQEADSIAIGEALGIDPPATIWPYGWEQADLHKLAMEERLR